jgi:hypothetical protein
MQVRQWERISRRPLMFLTTQTLDDMANMVTKWPPLLPFGHIRELPRNPYTYDQTTAPRVYDVSARIYGSNAAARQVSDMMMMVSCITWPLAPCMLAVRNVGETFVMMKMWTLRSSGGRCHEDAGGWPEQHHRSILTISLCVEPFRRTGEQGMAEHLVTRGIMVMLMVRKVLPRFFYSSFPPNCLSQK